MITYQPLTLFPQVLWILFIQNHHHHLKRKQSDDVCYLKKQKEALRSGRSRRWSHLAHISQDPYNTQPEPTMLPPEEPLPEPPRQPKQHPFFDLNSSESSSSEESEEEEEEQKQPAGLPPQLGKSKTKKPRIPSAIK